MSYTEIFKIKQNGDVELSSRINNAWRGFNRTWLYLEEKYLPSLPKPCYASDRPYYHRMNTCDSSLFVEVWELYYDKNVTIEDKILIGHTFDDVVIFKKDIPIFINILYNSHKEIIEYYLKQSPNDVDEYISSLKEMADLIKQLYDNDEDFIGVCFNGTSVISDVWLVYNDIGDDDEYDIKPYNIFNNKKHWDLFESLKINDCLT